MSGNDVKEGENTYALGRGMVRFLETRCGARVCRASVTRLNFPTRFHPWARSTAALGLDTPSDSFSEYYIIMMISWRTSKCNSAPHRTASDRSRSALSPTL